MKLVNIAICDDDKLTCINLSKTVRAYMSQTGIEFSIREYYNGASLLAATHPIDIVLLDIKMDTMDGLQTATRLRENHAAFALVFITSAPEYVYESFDVQAFHYLIKPVNEQKLKEVLASAIRSVAPSQETFFVFQRNRETVKVNLSDVLYFEILGRIVYVHTAAGTLEYYEKMELLERKVQDKDFFRCHKSYMVNLDKVIQWDKIQIILEGNVNIPLAKRRYDSFSTVMLSYLKKVGGLL